MKIKLYTAVLLAIKKMGLDNFSVFDITQKIRESLASGDICDITDLYNITTTGVKIVSRESVKDIIEEIYHNKVLNMSMGYSSVKGDSFRVFNVLASPVPAFVTDSVLKAVPCSLGEVNAIKKYLSSISRVEWVTIKNIQSALKTQGLTCELIYNLVKNNTLNRIEFSSSDESNEFYSKARVWGTKIS